MTTAHEVPPLILGDLSFEASTRLRKRLFGRPKSIPSVVVTLPGHRVEFDARELCELAEGPAIISAESLNQQEDYFLASVFVIEPSSAVGASMQNQQYDANSLLLLHGQTVLAELSGPEPSGLIAWLKPQC